MTTASVNERIQLIVKGQSKDSTCSTSLAKGPWEFDGGPAAYGPGSSSEDVIPADAPRQGVLPDEYKTASQDELHARIVAAKATLGDKVVILGHFYQREEIVQHADYLGDSFQLAVAAKGRPEAEHIVFCGVHFMAETADILSNDEQKVILPNLAAGCSMADMADADSVEDCWEQLMELYGTEADADGRVPVIPVTYMNSSAALKAFCGRNGGIVCTSSNAEVVLKWAFERGQRVLFFPDQHLGRNTAVLELGLTLDDWQQFCLTEMLQRDARGLHSAFEAAVVVPRQNGKGGLLEARQLWGLFLGGEVLQVHTAHEFKTCFEHFLRIVSLIENTPDLDAKVQRIRRGAGEQAVELKSGERLRFLARSAGSGRGFSGDAVYLDEAYALTAPIMGALLPTMSAVPNPQLVYTSSAPSFAQPVLFDLVQRGRQGGSPRLFYAEWGNEENVDRHDKDAWYRANPALGIRIDEAFIEAELEAMDRHRAVMRDRIARHRADRGDGWTTVEAPLDLVAALAAAQPDEAVLVDCATLWLSNHLLADHDLDAEAQHLLAALAACPAPVIIVSNEVGWGIVPDNALARAFRDAQGRLNQQIAAQAGLVLGVMAGLPMVLKGKLPEWM